MKEFVKLVIIGIIGAAVGGLIVHYVTRDKEPTNQGNSGFVEEQIDNVIQPVKASQTIKIIEPTNEGSRRFSAEGEQRKKDVEEQKRKDIEESKRVQTLIDKKIQIDADKFSEFEFVIPEDGTITISLELFAECTLWMLVNETGKSQNPTNKNIDYEGSRSGGCQPCSVRGRYIVVGSDCIRVEVNHDDKLQVCSWNSRKEMFKGNFTFKLDAGTYYFRIVRGQTGLSSANLLIQHKALR